MRLDKFLKSSRLIKRRTLAQEVIKAGKVLLNGRQAKPGSRVKPGDLLELKWGNRQTRLEILEIRENVRADMAAELYKIID